MLEPELQLTVTLVRTVGFGALHFRDINEGRRVVAAVCQELAGSGEALDERKGRLLVRSLSGRECSAAGHTLGIRDDADFAAQSSMSPVDDVTQTPFFHLPRGGGRGY